MPDHALASLLTKKAVHDEVRTQALTAGYTDAPSWASGIERLELETLFLTGTAFDPAAHTAGSPQDYLVESSWSSRASPGPCVRHAPAFPLQSCAAALPH